MATVLQASITWLAAVGAAAWLMATLAILAATRLVRHAHDLPLPGRWRWTALAATVLGTSAWALPLLMHAGDVAVRSYSLPVVLAAWFGASVLSALALGIAMRAPLQGARLWAGALVASLAGPTASALALCAAGGQLSAPQGLSAGGLVWLAGSGAAGLALIGSLRGPSQVQPVHHVGRLLAAALMGLSWLVCDALLWHAEAGPGAGALADALPLLPDAVAVGAIVASLALSAAGEAWRAHRARQASPAGMSGNANAAPGRDALTGLPNRQSFEGTLTQATQLADGRGGRLALLQIALDGVGPINLAYGHHGGDVMLQEVARRLRPLGRPHMVARLHSDEFLLLLNDDPGEAESTALAQRVQHALSQPMRLAGKEIHVSCSVGIALYPEHGARARLIANASLAVRAAKRAGGATHSLFDPRLMDDAIDRAELVTDLRAALQRGQFDLVYQPKVHAPTGEITGAEALLRWNHPWRGAVSPAVFIPLAERCGLMYALGDWVIEQACQQARRWRDQGLRMRVAVNLSPVQLRQPDLARKIAAALRRHAVNPSLLTCEITESVALEDSASSRQVFQELAEIGVHISIDDFGSGYSNLASLRKLPAGELKIDRSFVIDLATSEDARRVVRAVVTLAKELGRQVVAEGVESEAQYEILRDLGCDHLQGFLFAKPMGAQALGLWAMGDAGPRTMQFRASLFKDTKLLQPA